MANEAEVEYVTLVRVLEYYGPRAWVAATLAKGGVPMQGMREFGAGANIKSGIVQYVPQEASEPATPGPIATLPPTGREA